MSRKCCSQAARMEISRRVMPSDAIRARALSCVRSEVPKPGMVTPMMPSRGSFKRSKAAMATMSASVESSPPEMPITARRRPMWRSRSASACDWMRNVSRQRRSRAVASSGTKGCGGMVRLSGLSSVCTSKGMVSSKLRWACGAKGLRPVKCGLRKRSWLKAARSTSLMRSCASAEKVADSATIRPRSAMKASPSKK